MKSGLTVCACLACMLQCTSLFADTEYEIRLGGERSDNIRRAPVNEIEETVWFLGLILDWQREAARIDMGVRSDLEYRTYKNDIFDNEVVGTLAADVNLKFVPEVFEWMAQYNFGDVQLDPFAPNTAANRETLNVFATGPDLRMRMGSSTAFEASGRWAQRNYELSDTSSKRTRGRIGLVRALSPHRRLSLNASREKVEYDNPAANPEFEITAGFLQFESEIARGSLDIMLGINEIEQLGTTTDGPLYDIKFSREISAKSTLHIGATQRFQDQAGGFVRNQTLADVAPDNTQTFGSRGAYEDRLGFITWGYSHARTSLSLSYLVNTQEYASDSAFDRDRDRWRFRLTRAMGSSWEIDLRANISQTDYVGIDRDDDDINYGLSISRRFSTTFTVEIGFERSDRESSLPQFDYVERVATLTFKYGR